jgi:hypothetical protein
LFDDVDETVALTSIVPMDVVASIVVVVDVVDRTSLVDDDKVVVALGATVVVVVVAGAVVVVIIVVVVGAVVVVVVVVVVVDVVDVVGDGGGVGTDEQTLSSTHCDTQKPVTTHSLCLPSQSSAQQRHHGGDPTFPNEMWQNAASH